MAQTSAGRDHNPLINNKDIQSHEDWMSFYIYLLAYLIQIFIQLENRISDDGLRSFRTNRDNLHRYTG